MRLLLKNCDYMVGIEPTACALSPFSGVFYHHSEHRSPSELHVILKYIYVFFIK